MKFYKIFYGVLLTFFSFLPLSTMAQISPTTGITQAVTMEEVREFIDEYSKRYMKMDLDAFMDLFSREAVENRMLPYADIREAYRRAIEINKSIQYNIKVISIQTYTKSAFVSGRYKIIQTFKEGDKRKVSQGNIQWELVRENGSLKIKEVNFGRDRLE